MLFTSKEIMPGVFSITDAAQTHCFLAVGTRKAVLIDTGIGLGSLKDFVDKITQLPLTVIGTHGHLDHIGGATEFDEVYLSSRDFDLASRQTLESRIDYVSGMYAAIHPGEKCPFKASDFIPVRTAPYKELDGIETFDLGGMTLRILPLPGHTQGCVTVLFEKERAILFGDACNPGVFLFGEEASCVEAYMNTLENFKQNYEFLYDRVIVSHGGEFIDKSILDNDIAICREIMDGTDDHAPIFLHGSSALNAKKTGDFGRRLDGGFGNIVYNPNKIFIG